MSDQSVTCDMIHVMVHRPTDAGSQGASGSGVVSPRRGSLRDVLTPRLTTLTFVTLGLLALSCLTTVAMVLYMLEPFDTKVDDWFGIGALLVLIAVPYVVFAPVLVWLPRTRGESVLGLLAVLFVCGVGVATNVDVLFFSDNPLNAFVIAAIPWWQLIAIAIISAVMGLARIGHWVLVGRGSATRS